MSTPIRPPITGYRVPGGVWLHAGRRAPDRRPIYRYHPEPPVPTAPPPVPAHAP